MSKTYSLARESNQQMLACMLSCPYQNSMVLFPAVKMGHLVPQQVNLYTEFMKMVFCVSQIFDDILLPTKEESKFFHFFVIPEHVF